MVDTVIDLDLYQTPSEEIQKNRRVFYNLWRRSDDDTTAWLKRAQNCIRLCEFSTIIMEFLLIDRFVCGLNANELKSIQSVRKSWSLKQLLEYFSDGLADEDSAVMKMEPIVIEEEFPPVPSVEYVAKVTEETSLQLALDVNEIDHETIINGMEFECEEYKFPSDMDVADEIVHSNENHYDQSPAMKRNESDQNCHSNHTQPSNLIKRKRIIQISKGKSYICNLCGEVFNRLSMLKEHKKRAHQRIRLHVCSTCNKRFVSTMHLKRHCLTHSKTQNKQPLTSMESTNQQTSLTEELPELVQNAKPATSTNSTAPIVHTTVDTTVHTSQQQIPKTVKKNSAGLYVCDCGYNAGKIKSRLVSHQSQHCKKHEKSVRSDLPCPICGKEFTYGGLKSHLLPFTKTNRKHGTYSEAHALQTADEHRLHLQKVKEKYGSTLSRYANSFISTKSTTPLVHATVDTTVHTSQQQKPKTVKKNAAGLYVCDCGYNAGKIKSRLVSHQSQHCKNRERSVRDDLPCPICGKEFTYGGLKSHLLPFTKTDRRNQTYNRAHALRSVDDHKLDLQSIKEKFGPAAMKRKFY